MDTQKEREAFEEFYKTQILTKDYEIEMIDQLTEFHIETGLYEYVRMQTAWQSWQAAKAQAAPEWISVKDQLPPSDPYNREYWVYETLNNKVQHDYWVCPDSDLDQDFEPFFNNWLREVTYWMPMVKYPKPPVQTQEPAND